MLVARRFCLVERCDCNAQTPCVGNVAADSTKRGEMGQVEDYELRSVSKRFDTDSGERDKYNNRKERIERLV